MGQLKQKRQRKIFIIAEAGVNHNGSLVVAKKMVDAAQESGADAIKFQTFTAEKTISVYAPKAKYQERYTPKNESQFEMVKRLELDGRAHRELFMHCKKRKIMFLSTPFDPESIDLLCSLGLKIFKIPSGEIINVPYLQKIGRLRKKIILSTGMASLKEVKDALGILINCGTKKQDITVLHCNTEYPTPMEDVNLRAMLTIKKIFNVRIGYSDHTLGIEIPIAAAALGASVIEKHFTLDRTMEGPDHKISLEPPELANMIKAIRNIEKALGDGIKRPSPSEGRNIKIVRKSIVAARDILKGTRLTSQLLALKRPGTGIKPKFFDALIGREVKRDIKKDEILAWDLVKKM